MSEQCTRVFEIYQSMFYYTTLSSQNVLNFLNPEPLNCYYENEKTRQISNKGCGASGRHRWRVHLVGESLGCVQKCHGYVFAYNVAIASICQLLEWNCNLNAKQCN